MLGMRAQILLLLIVGWMTLSVSAQESLPDNGSFDNHVLSSKVLKQDRDIQVFLPESYHQRTGTYAVLYITDGQQYFFNGVAYQKSFHHFDLTPEFIVVGVTNYHPQRLEVFSDDQLLDFFEKELIPFIDEQYRTNDDRLIFGWQVGGYFVSKALLDRPHLFNAYFAASGVSGETTPNTLESYLAQGELKSEKFMYFTLSPEETYSMQRITAFSDFLVNNASESLRWEFELLEDEAHKSTAYRTIYRGLLKYYADFKPVRFNSLEEFEEAGGLDSLRQHYRKRGKKYTTSDEIHRRTVFNLLQRAMQEDNFEAFDGFMSEFQSSQLENWYKWDNWQTFLQRYGQFYLNNDQADKALVIFEITSQKFPEEAFVYNDLGNGYRARAELENAALNYKKAIEIANKSGDPNLAEYEENLRSLSE
jgi:predicted alpha/beta superfamily hydrolase